MSESRIRPPIRVKALRWALRLVHSSWFDELGGLTHIEGNLYRSPIPFFPRHFDALERAGIRVVFSMEEAVPGADLQARGFDWRPHFWTDDVPPQVHEMERFLAEYLAVPDDTRVVVHCRAGYGRTGSAVACALMAKHGLSAEEALSHFWSRVPSAKRHMVRNGQAEFVRGYHARLKGRNPIGV